MTMIAIMPTMPTLIVFDTFARAMMGGDENSAQDVGAFKLSPDGTRILFTSNAQNLAPNDGNAFNQDIYVKTP